MTERVLQALRDGMAADLTGNVLPWWMANAVDERRGGFAGFVGEDGTVDGDAPKGAILNARILWTFSAAFRALGDAGYRAMADRAAEYLRRVFIDPEHGGVYWMVDADGAPLDTRKHVYAQAFAIYALAEHHRATGSPSSLADAITLFWRVEEHAHDAVHGGYHEAFSRGWTLLDDVRLSAVDAPERRSMNTHLHLLEAYTALFRAWPDARLGARLRALVELFLSKIVRPDGHLRGFFDDDWTPRGDTVSFGHDIEAAWLLLEAAEVLEDAELRGCVRDASIRIASAVLDEGFDGEHGGIFYEAAPGAEVVTDKEWWPQAEAVVGFLAAYEATGREDFRGAAAATWAFTRRHLVDAEGGEWHRRVSREGRVRPGHEKAGPWKCPYHNGRAALEVMARVERLSAAAQAA